MLMLLSVHTHHRMTSPRTNYT